MDKPRLCGSHSFLDMRLRLEIFCVCILALAAYRGDGFNNILKGSQMEFELLNGTAGSKALVEGYLYPLDSNGNPLTQFWVYMGIYGWSENVTNRDILPASTSQLQATNPAPNEVALAWNFISPYSSDAHGVFTFQLLPPGSNNSFGGLPIIGQGGLKVSGAIENDSNKYNISTAKSYYFNLTLSHPILGFTSSLYPTPYQDNYNFTTKYYSVIFNQPSFTVSDGQNTAAYAGISSFVSGSNGSLVGLVVEGTTFWLNNWEWDPEIGIILDPGVGDSGTTSGDGGSNANLAYIALVALILAPIVVLIVVAIGLVYYFIKRHRIVHAVTKAASTVEHV